jgi:hypothetical protein
MKMSGKSARAILVMPSLRATGQTVLCACVCMSFASPHACDVIGSAIVIWQPDENAQRSPYFLTLARNDDDAEDSDETNDEDGAETGDDHAGSEDDAADEGDGDKE